MNRLSLQPGPLVLALAAAFAAVPVHAQSPGSQVEAPVRFSIAAKPLAQALNEWALQTRTQLIVQPELVRGKTAPAVSGNLTPRQAMDRLLANSGLTAAHDGAAVVIQVAPPAAGAARLPEVSVTADASSAAVTEGTNSYTTSSMSTATKLDLSMRETPQAVTVITRQRIEDQGLATLNEVMQSTPGVTFRNFGPERSSYYSRGMYIDNVMYDGVPVSLDASYLSQDLLASDMAIYDRVEVVRGSTGLVQGAGNPSAAINMVRKRPTKEKQFSFTGSVGNWDRYRGMLDASGPLSEDGSLRARGVVAYQDEKSYKARAGSDRAVFYGILEKDIGSRTTATLSALHQEDNLDGNGFTGLPVGTSGADLKLPRSTSYANDWEYWNKTTNSIFAGLEHRFDSGWKVNLSTYQSRAKVDMLGHYLNTSVTTGLVNQLAARNHHEEEQGSYDLYASGPFSLLGREHQLVVGSSYRRTDFEGQSKQGLLLASAIDLYNFDPSAVARPDIALQGWLNANIRQKSTYATTRLNLADRLKLIVGARLDWFDYKDRYPTAGTSSQYSVTRNVTKYAGLIYDLDKRHSAYVSYTDIFKPQNYVDSSRNVLAPIKGKNYELGIKGEYFNGALNASAALFRIDQENRAKRMTDQTQCAGYPTQVCYEAAGLVRSQGVEFEVQGAILPNWQLGGGYTFADATYRKDADATKIGKLFDTDTPRHLFKLSTMYKFVGDLNQWRIGGSLYWQNKIYNEGTVSGVPFRIEQKAYALLDLVVGYRATQNMDLRLNINNVFDKTYYNALSGSTNFPSNVYGAPRSVMMTMNYKF